MLSEGQIFDNTYRLVRLVGEGGMGAVYEATHARLAGRYAIKVLLRKLSDNTEAMVRFNREARITSLLQHPNVVQVIDYNTAADGTEYLVMEYLAGESLAQRLYTKGKLNLETVVDVVEQISAGLVAAHAHGIVHRDLKPDNVFLVPVEGRDVELVKILDFGISKVKEHTRGVQVEGMLFGTPQYMAPEQIDGRATEIDAATDQFALGVMTYEMLTGRNPFQAETLTETFARVLNSHPAPTGVGWDVDLVLRRALAKSKKDRYLSVADFSEALRAAATGRTNEVQRLATVAYAAGEMANHEIRGKSRQRSWAVTLGAAVLVCVSLSFLLGGAANRNLAPVSALSAVPPSGAPRQHDGQQNGIGRRLPDRQVALTDRADVISTAKLPADTVAARGIPEGGPAARDAIEVATYQTVRPVVVPLPAERRSTRSSSATRKRRSGRAEPPVQARPATTWTSIQQALKPAVVATPAAPRSRPSANLKSLPMDDEATLPLDETRFNAPVVR